MTEQTTAAPNATVQVVDMTAEMRKRYSDPEKILGRTPLEHDWRLVVATDQGQYVTLNRGATADDVAEWCEREGWAL